jgi:hypothetical protein
LHSHASTYAPPHTHTHTHTYTLTYLYTCIDSLQNRARTHSVDAMHRGAVTSPVGSQSMHRGGEEAAEAEAEARSSTEGDAVGKVGVTIFDRGGDWAPAVV